MAMEIKKKSLDELNQLFEQATQIDQELFAEQRSNVLLVAGDHYTKKASRFWSRVRDTKELSSEQRLRLTKNHIQKITKGYINNILSLAPGVTPLPQNEKELQDIKAAELHSAVWEDAKEKYHIKKKIRDYASDFVTLGEVAVKIFWDPNKGKIKGYEQKVDENGEPVFDEQGQPEAGDPIYEGEFVFERIFGFNLRRCPDAQCMDDSPYLCIQKMTPIEELEQQLKDPELASKVQKATEKTFVVFDMESGGYGVETNQALVKECYYRPSAEYPNGYFYIWTGDVELFSGELPFGFFPIVYTGFDEFQTSPRGRSIIKVARPYQVEINRSASKMAEHQVTLGDDKLLIQQGSKLSSGGTVPGVRGITYNGIPPTILQGRDGSQYLNYMNSQIQEMYAACNMQEDSEKIETQADAYATLYRAMRQKKKYAVYSEKFEQFLVDFLQLFLELAKRYLPDDYVVYAIGSKERVNISEFRNLTKLCYQIKLEPVSQDAETLFGKQLAMNHMLQYVGTNLEREEIGKIIKNMPFANVDESLSDLTMDYDNGTNLILALDRGERVQPNRYDNHTYLIKRLVTRTRQADFKYLPPQIQQSYAMTIQMHEQIQAQVQAELQRAQAGYIPTGGYLVVADFYVPDPKDPKKTQRARVPYQAMEWLLKKLDEQGSSLASYEGLNPQSQIEIGQMAAASLAQQPSMPRSQMGQGAM